MRRLAALSGVNKSTVIMLERGDIPTPQPDTLILLARALNTPVADLFLIAGWLPADELPSLSVYLRSRFPDLDDQQITDAAAYLAALPRAPVR